LYESPTTIVSYGFVLILSIANLKI
jgi:hypothetical protein